MVVQFWHTWHRIATTCWSMPDPPWRGSLATDDPLALVLLAKGSCTCRLADGPFHACSNDVHTTATVTPFTPFFRKLLGIPFTYPTSSISGSIHFLIPAYPLARKSRSSCAAKDLLKKQLF